jgi:hypothetical protein
MRQRRGRVASCSCLGLASCLKPAAETASPQEYAAAKIAFASFCRRACYLCEHDADNSAKQLRLLLPLPMLPLPMLLLPMGRAELGRAASQTCNSEGLDWVPQAVKIVVIFVKELMLSMKHSRTKRASTARAHNFPPSSAVAASVGAPDDERVCTRFS